MWPIPLTPLTAGVRPLNVPNVSSFSRHLALVALCFLRAVFLSACFLRRFFRANTFFAFHSVPGVFYPASCLRSSDVLGAALPPRLDFSIVDTFVYSRVPSEHSSSPHFGSHVFRGGGVPTLLPQAYRPSSASRVRTGTIYELYGMLSLRKNQTNEVKYAYRKYPMSSLRGGMYISCGNRSPRG